MVRWGNWIKEKGPKILKAAGIKKGDIVLDFGARKGDYSLPAATLVGKQGEVFALDMDGQALRKCKKRAKRYSLANLTPIETEGQFCLDVDSSSVDVVLLFDVLHYFTLQERRKLYSETRRILKSKGLLIAFPQHNKDSYPLWNLSTWSIEDIKNEIENSGFKFYKECQCRLIHDHAWWENGLILTFSTW